MGDADGGIGLVDVLPAGAARAEGVDLEFALVDLELHFVCFRQDRDGGGGRLDASLALGLGDPLHAVDARLEFEAGVGAVAGNLERDLLVPAEFGRVGAQDFRFEALRLRVHGVHAQERAREQSRFFPAGATSDLDDDVLVVVRVSRQQKDLQFLGKVFHRVFRGRSLFLGKFLHLFVDSRLVQKHFRFGKVGFRFSERPIGLDDGRHILMLFQERCVLFNVGDHSRVCKFRFKRGESLLNIRKVLKHQATLPPGPSGPF